MDKAKFTGAYLNGAYYPFGSLLEYAVYTGLAVPPESEWKPFVSTISGTCPSGSVLWIDIRSTGSKIVSVSGQDAYTTFNKNSSLPNVLNIVIPGADVAYDGVVEPGTFTITFANGSKETLVAKGDGKNTVTVSIE
ncbi:hypothetical protein [Lacticaseibacillus zhaodongensis]|uniref:hypothetical protein n=1 Tax=Lacticaseibacillus zhaodongensis TaxID=2668065 RepID=UPI0012D36509|nr:hypothetical protein [Lacticaseibacillus zhaodongensis]